MKIEIKLGKYVVAVSGGVDSMVLLDLLIKKVQSPKSKVQSFQLVVAHFDHGIREDSSEDRKLVQKISKEHGLQFEFAEGHLGAGTSEDSARKARYEFLHNLRQKYQADAVITAHHEDDLIETALLNIIRGTGRKGLTSLQSTDVIKRPLLHLTKQELLGYAKAHGIKWREDSTNQDTAYLRNYIRKHIIPKLTPAKRAELVKLLSTMKVQNKELDIQIAKYLHLEEENNKEIKRQRFIGLPHDVACEVMAGWLRHNGIRDFDRKTIERLVIAAKTLRPGQRSDVNKTNYLFIDKDILAITAPGR